MTRVAAGVMVGNMRPYPAKNSIAVCELAHTQKPKSCPKVKQPWITAIESGERHYETVYLYDYIGRRHVRWRGRRFRHRQRISLALALVRVLGRSGVIVPALIFTGDSLELKRTE